MIRYVFAAVSSGASYFTSSTTSKELIQITPPNEYWSGISSSFPITSPLPDEQTGETKYETIYDILRRDDLYDVLSITPDVADDLSALRRAYLARSRHCHPDKYPENKDSTAAFQKVSLAYNILSNPSTRRAYDANPKAADDLFKDPRSAEDTFDGVLQLLFADFMSGDFEIIRMVLKTMKEVNPALQMEDETVETVINGFKKVREVVLGTRTYVRVLRHELLHLYDIQYNLRQLPYLAISARLRLTLKFTRVALSLPNAIDRAIEAEEAEKQRRRAAHAAAGLENGTAAANAQVGKRSSLLGPKIGGVVNFLVVALEKSESVL